MQAKLASFVSPLTLFYMAVLCLFVNTRLTTFLPSSVMVYNNMLFVWSLVGKPLRNTHRIIQIDWCLTLLIGIRLDWDLVFFMVYPAGYPNNKNLLIRIKWSKIAIVVKDQAEVKETTESDNE